MRFILSVSVLILCLSACNEKSEKKAETDLKAEPKKLKVEPIESLDLSKVPDSLELIPDRYLLGDFTGNNKTDFASLVRNRVNQKIGVLILNDSEEGVAQVFGAGKTVSGMTDLNWIETFETLPKGELISPTLVDKETGDIIGKDKSREFKLLGNGISMSVEESHGGGIIFWNGNEYQWYQIE